MIIHHAAVFSKAQASRSRPWLAARRGQKSSELTIASTHDSPVRIGGVGSEGDLKHVDNILECIRTRKQPNCNAELGYRTLIATALSVRSYRNGKMYYFDSEKEVVTEKA